MFRYFELALSRLQAIGCVFEEIWQSLLFAFEIWYKLLVFVIKILPQLYNFLIGSLIEESSDVSSPYQPTMLKILS